MTTAGNPEFQIATDQIAIQFKSGPEAKPPLIPAGEEKHQIQQEGKAAGNGSGIAGPLDAQFRKSEISKDQQVIEPDVDYDTGATYPEYMSGQAQP
jgi:hypothetical protein